MGVIKKPDETPTYDAAWLTTTEAAHRLGLSQNRVTQMAQGGKLRAELCGRRWRVCAAAVEARKAMYNSGGPWKREHVFRVTDLATGRIMTTSFRGHSRLQYWATDEQLAAVAVMRPGQVLAFDHDRRGPVRWTVERVQRPLLPVASHAR